MNIPPMLYDLHICWIGRHDGWTLLRHNLSIFRHRQSAPWTSVLPNWNRERANLSGEYCHNGNISKVSWDTLAHPSTLGLVVPKEIGLHRDCPPAKSCDHILGSDAYSPPFLLASELYAELFLGWSLLFIVYSQRRYFSNWPTTEIWRPDSPLPPPARSFSLAFSGSNCSIWSP